MTDELSQFFSYGFELFFLIKSLALAKPDGKPLFYAKCAACHNEDAAGNKKLKELVSGDVTRLDLTSDKARSKKDSDLEVVILDGKGNMPSFNDELSKVDLRAIIKYIRLSQKNILAKTTK